MKNIIFEVVKDEETPPKYYVKATVYKSALFGLFRWKKIYWSKFINSSYASSFPFEDGDNSEFTDNFDRADSSFEKQIAIKRLKSCYGAIYGGNIEGLKTVYSPQLGIYEESKFNKEELV